MQDMDSNTNVIPSEKKLNSNFRRLIQLTIYVVKKILIIQFIKLALNA